MHHDLDNVTGRDLCAWACLLQAAAGNLPGIGMLFALQFEDPSMGPFQTRGGFPFGVFPFGVAAWSPAPSNASRRWSGNEWSVTRESPAPTPQRPWDDRAP
jgi:hypothetical protein